MRLNKMRFNFSKLQHHITIHELKTVTDNGMPIKPEKVEYLSCFAHIESVSLKDYETSVQMGTQNRIKLFIRNYPNITNKMSITHNNDEYNIIQVLYDYRQSGFTILVAEEVTR